MAKEAQAYDLAREAAKRDDGSRTDITEQQADESFRKAMALIDEARKLYKDALQAKPGEKEFQEPDNRMEKAVNIYATITRHKDEYKKAVELQAEQQAKLKKSSASQERAGAQGNSFRCHKRSERSEHRLSTRSDCKVLPTRDRPRYDNRLHKGSEFCLRRKSEAGYEIRFQDGSLNSSYELPGKGGFHRQVDAPTFGRGRTGAQTGDEHRHQQARRAEQMKRLVLPFLVAILGISAFAQGDGCAGAMSALLRVKEEITPDLRDRDTLKKMQDTLQAASANCRDQPEIFYYRLLVSQRLGDQREAAYLAAN